MNSAAEQAEQEGAMLREALALARRLHEAQLVVAQQPSNEDVQTSVDCAVGQAERTNQALQGALAQAQQVQDAARAEAQRATVAMADVKSAAATLRMELHQHAADAQRQRQQAASAANAELQRVQQESAARLGTLQTELQQAREEAAAARRHDVLSATAGEHGSVMASLRQEAGGGTPERPDTDCDSSPQQVRAAQVHGAARIAASRRQLVSTASYRGTHFGDKYTRHTQARSPP